MFVGLGRGEWEGEGWILIVGVCERLILELLHFFEVGNVVSIMSYIGLYISVKV
jgi:hypothetical protein